MRGRMVHGRWPNHHTPIEDRWSASGGRQSDGGNRSNKNHTTHACISKSRVQSGCAGWTRASEADRNTWLAPYVGSFKSYARSEPVKVLGRSVWQPRTAHRQFRSISKEVEEIHCKLDRVASAAT